jgi:hypothetical protein
LDIFHARKRILKDIWKKYPDYRPAKQDLNSIFALIKQWKYFLTPQNLTDTLKNWCNKYLIIYPTAKLSFKKQMEFLAINRNW